MNDDVWCGWCLNRFRPHEIDRHLLFEHMGAKP